ncbi:MAG TPA: hypothetical protein V6C76_06890 [Drouetiella sp.]
MASEKGNIADNVKRAPEQTNDHNANVNDNLFAGGYGDKLPKGNDTSSDRSPVTINLEQAKEGIPTDRPVTIQIQNNKGSTEPAQLFDMLAKQNGSYEFVKPALKPGQPGYYEADAVKVDKPLRVASYEGKLTNANITMPDGSNLHVDELPRGTVYDGSKIYSADATQKGITVGDKFIPNGTQATADGGQIANPGDRLIVRPQMENGKPIVDSYPISDTKDPANPNAPTQFEKRWADAGDGKFVPIPVPTEKTILPANVTIKSVSEHGEVTIAPGDAYRKDGYSVKPEPLLQTWNGYTNEKSFKYLEDQYAKAGLQDSPQSQALQAERNKALGLPAPEFAPPVEAKGPADVKGIVEKMSPDEAKTKGAEEEGRVGKALPWLIGAGIGLTAIERALIDRNNAAAARKEAEKAQKDNEYVMFTPDIWSAAPGR